MAATCDTNLELFRDVKLVWKLEIPKEIRSGIDKVRIMGPEAGSLSPGIAKTGRKSWNG